MDADGVIANIASRQHALIAVRQALEGGVTRKALETRRKAGGLVIRHRGLYAIAGAPRTWRQDVMAAVLVCGEGAAASCVEAAVLFALTETRRSDIHIVLPAHRRCRVRNGIVVHQAALARTDVRRIEGIPATAPNRTVVDLAGEVTAAELEDALDTALLKGLTSLRALRRYIDQRHLGHRSGVGLLNRLIDDRALGVPESRLERIFLAKLRTSRLPAPTRQFRVGRRRIDMSYPDRRVIVELDGYGTRYARTALQKDRRRQNEVVLGLPGWTLLRFTWDDVADDWPYIEATLREALTT